MRMEIEYSLTVEDLEALTRYRWKHGRSPTSPYRVMTKNVTSIALIILLCLAMAVQSAIFPIKDLSTIYFGYGFFLGLLLMLIPQLWVVKRSLRVIRQLYENEESRWVLARRRMTISPQGI